MSTAYERLLTSASRHSDASVAWLIAAVVVTRLADVTTTYLAVCALGSRFQEANAVMRELFVQVGLLSGLAVAFLIGAVGVVVVVEAAIALFERTTDGTIRGCPLSTIRRSWYLVPCVAYLLAAVTNVAVIVATLS